MENTSCLINIPFEQGEASPKGADEPQTSDPFTEWLNFMFKYSKTSLSRQARGEGLAELAGIPT